MRTGDEPNARRALESAFRVDPYDVLTYNLLQLLDELDEVSDDHRRRSDRQAAPDEVGVLREYVPALAKAGAAGADQAVELHAQGADPDRSLSDSTTTSPFAHSGCPG